MRGNRLVLRFGIVSLIPVLALGLVVGRLVRDVVEERMLHFYATSTQATMTLFVDNLLRPEDFERGLPPERIALVRGLLAGVRSSGGQQLVNESVDVRLVDRDGDVVFAMSDAELGQRRPTSGPMAAALAGESGAEFLAERDAEGGRSIRVALPVMLGNDPAVVGALDLVLPDTEITEPAEAGVRRIRLALAAGLALLWAVMLPIAFGASRRLRQRATENRRLALHDTLTGLPNRTLLADRLSLAVAACKRRGGHAGLLLVDLDRFKEVNDSLGHDKGDRLLEHVARRLSATVRPGDTVARLGGDEFAVVVPEVADPAELASLAARLTEALGEPVDVGGVALVAEASIGIAWCPTDGEDAAVLLQRADVAMYAAKAAGSPFAFYSPEADANSPSRLALVSDLRRALEGDGELVLHYQPLASVATGEVRAMEALLRWHHPTRGAVPPDEFVPLAEASGLVRLLTQWVLERALAQCAAWRDEGLDVVVAVNLSARNLREPDLVERIADLLARHGLPPGLLELEVTESALIADPELAKELLSRISALGVSLALDDFGTEYSSLAYLKDLPADELKIDRQFVAAMTTSEAHASIVRSVIDLAHSLGMRVTAEGVETEEQRRRLAALACDWAQGYHLARPLPAAEAAAHARRMGPRRAPELAER